MQNALRIYEQEEEQLSQQELNERFVQFFTAKTGVHPIEKIVNGKVIGRTFYTKDVVAQIRGSSRREDLFWTLNSTKHHERTKEQACGMSAIAVDIDCYNVKHLQKWQVLHQLPEFCDDNNIFYPTAIVDSGNGLYFVWKLEEQVSNSEQFTYQFEKATKALQKKFKAFGSDPRATDALRLFRLPNTINTKHGRKNEVNVHFLNEDAIFELQDFHNEVVEEKKKQNAGKTKRKSQINSDGYSYNYDKTSAVTHLFNPFTLAKARAGDLVRLMEIRGGAKIGYRNTVIHLYGVQLKQMNEPDVLGKMHDMNNAFRRPLRPREVESILKNLDKKAETGTTWKERTYQYRNETIIDVLDICEAEWRQLKCIIPPEESKRRKKEWWANQYAPIKEETQRKKRERNQIISEMAREGYKQKEIAERVGVTTRTVRNVLKAEKDTK